MTIWTTPGDHQSPRRQETRQAKDTFIEEYITDAHHGTTSSASRVRFPAQVDCRSSKSGVPECASAPHRCRSCHHGLIRVRAETSGRPFSERRGRTISVPPDGADRQRRHHGSEDSRREASEANNKAMGIVLLALKNAGIAEKDFQILAAVAVAAAADVPTRRSRSSATAPARATVTIRDEVADSIDILVGSGANSAASASWSQRRSKLSDEAARLEADRRREAEGGYLRRRRKCCADQHFERNRAGVRFLTAMAAGIAASAPSCEGGSNCG